LLESACLLLERAAQIAMIRDRTLTIIAEASKKDMGLDIDRAGGDTDFPYYFNTEIIALAD